MLPILQTVTCPEGEDSAAASVLTQGAWLLAHLGSAEQTVKAMLSGELQ